MSDTSEEPSETTRLMSADRAQPRGPGREGDARAQTTVDENGEVNLRVGVRQVKITSGFPTRFDLNSLHCLTKRLVA